MGCRKMDVVSTNSVSSLEKDEDFLHWVNTRNVNWLELITEKQIAYNEVKNKDSLVEYFILDFDKVVKAEAYYRNRIAQKWGVDTAVARERLYKYLLQNGRYYDSVSRRKFSLAEEWLLYHQLINEGNMPWIGLAGLHSIDNTILQRPVINKRMGTNTGETVMSMGYDDYKELREVTVTSCYATDLEGQINALASLERSGIFPYIFSDICGGRALMDVQYLKANKLITSCGEIRYKLFLILLQLRLCVDATKVKFSIGGGGGSTGGGRYWRRFASA